MSTTLRVVKVLLLLLYTALFVVSELLFLRFGQKDPGVLTAATIPQLNALLLGASLLALLLTVLERGQQLLWGFLTHLQFILCFVPLVLNLIKALQEIKPDAASHYSASLTFSFDGVLLAYALLPINAICIIAYYVWLAMNKAKVQPATA